MFPKVLRGRLGKAAQNLDEKRWEQEEEPAVQEEKSCTWGAPWDVCFLRVAPCLSLTPSTHAVCVSSTFGSIHPWTLKSKNVSASSIKSERKSRPWAEHACPCVLLAVFPSLAFALTLRTYPQLSSHHAEKCLSYSARWAPRPPNSLFGFIIKTSTHGNP